MRCVVDGPTENPAHYAMFHKKCKGRRRTAREKSRPICQVTNCVFILSITRVLANIVKSAAWEAPLTNTLCRQDAQPSGSDHFQLPDGLVLFAARVNLADSVVWIASARKRAILYRE